MNLQRRHKAIACLTQSPGTEYAHGRTVDDTMFHTMVHTVLVQLDRPTEQYVPQTVVCMVGLVGSGKTTVARALAAHLPIVRLTIDDLRLQMLDRGWSLERARPIALSILDELLEEGQSVIVDADGAGNHKREAMMTLLQGRNIRCFWVKTTAPDAVIQERLFHAHDRWFIGEPAQQCYERRKVFHEDGSPWVDLVLDTTQPINVLIERVVQKLLKADSVDMT